MTRPSSPNLALILVITAIAVSGVAGAQDEGPLAEIILLDDSEQLERGRQSFLNGEYEDCQVILGQVDPMELGRVQRIQLHEMMGKALYILGDEEEASAQFFELLKLEPHYTMDPVSTPRRIIELYERVRTSHAKDLKLFPVEPERTIPGVNTPRVATSNMFVAFAPAGVFRLLFLRTPGRGWATLLAGQAAPFALSLSSYLYLNWASDKCNFVAVRNAIPAFRVVNIVSAIVGWAVYVAGIVDAFTSQGYHRQSPGSGKRRKVAEGWRWGPPVAAPSFAPD